MKLKKIGGFSIGTLISRVTGMGREIVYAYLFGSSLWMDAFQVAFNIPNLLRDFFGEGGMNAAFVPVFSEFYTKEGKEGANKYLSSFFLPLILVLFFIVFLGIIFSPHIISILAKGFTKNPLQFEVAVKLTRMMFPFLILISLASVVMGILIYFDLFFVTGFYTVFFNISVVMCSFLLYKSLGIFGVAVGVLIGGILQLLFLLFFLPKVGVKLRKPEWGHPGVKQSFKLLIPVFFSFAAGKINVSVTLFLASLLPTGNISHLTYAYRIMQLPLGMFGVAVAAVSLPEFSRKAAENVEQYPYILSALRAVFFLSVPAVFLSISLRVPIVRILYERGAFLFEDSLKTASLLLSYLLGMPFLAGSKVIGNVYFSKKDTKTPMVMSYISMIFNVILSIIMMGAFGAMGLALAVSISALIQFFLLMKPYLKIFKDLKSFFIKIIIASCLGGVPSIFLGRDFNYLFAFFFGLISFTLIFILIGYILKIEEIWKLIKVLKRQ
ncbi:MAG: murein biosynthesis integral membrane protein MurJ [candidate division WOR-3 bacterium]